VTLNFTDHVPVSNAADGGRAVAVTVNGRATDMGHVTIDNVLPSTQLCVESGSHLRSHRAGASQCFSYSQGGSYDERLVRADMGAAWASGDASRYNPRSRRGAADQTAFSNADVSTINSGFNLGEQCAHGADVVAVRTAVSNPQQPPAGFDFTITNQAGSWNGTNMTLPAGSPNLQTVAAAEATRTYGIFGDYGGYEVGNNRCAPEISYMTMAVNAGAPR
jgi:hypothetical protein